ncbi:MAG TPA: M20 family metallopeptidase [Thermoanaerobaculia bacterium]|nr:M20 family metallopeptidase [Thermoanaerobaculia bacterium]
MTRATSSSQAAELQRYFSARQETLLAGVRALVEQESPTGDAAATTAIIATLKKRLDAIGAATKLYETQRGAHLVSRVTFGRSFGDGPVLVLGHVDTVWPLATLSRMPFRVENGRAFGPGIFDMKSGVEVMVAALEAIHDLELEPRREIRLVLSCDEESGSTTSRDLITSEAWDCAAAFVLEPSLPGGKVKTARKGIASYEVIARGIAAHAGLDPEKGVSAISELAHQILALNALNDRNEGISVNVGVISGGTLSNVVAAEARAEVDVRFRTVAQGEEIARRIESMQHHQTGARIEIRGGINRPPLERTAAVVALFHRARSIASQLGFDLGEGSSGGASDGNFTAAQGIPTLDGLGVEGDGAHASHEHIVVADLPRRAALITALLTTPLTEAQT